MATYKGDCRAQFRSNADNIVVGRSLRTINDLSSMSDRSTWELNAGSSITLYYRKVATIGANNPTQVIINLYYETGTGTLVSTLHNGSDPTDGTSYTFWATSDGTSSGSPRAGTLRLYVRLIAVNTGGIATADYDFDSDGTIHSAFGATYITPITITDVGLIRSNAMVNDIAVSAYPAGSTFAYGTGSNESVTATVTHTQRYADRNVETIRINILDGTVTQATGTIQEVGATTTTTQAFDIVRTNFDDGAKSYGVEIEPWSASGLTPSSGPIGWTAFIDDGANVEQNGLNVRRQSFFNVNPDSTFVNVTPGQTVYNRGETATVTFGIQNARGEALTRSMPVIIVNSSATSMKGFSDTGPTYGDGGISDYVIGNTDKATYDLVGDQWTLIKSGANNETTFTNSPIVYGVSRKWQLSTSNSSVNNAIFVGKFASPSSNTGAARNRGQAAFFTCYVYNVRGTLLASPTINFNARPIATETYDGTSNSTLALSSGQFTGASATYTVDTDETTGGKALVLASQSTTSGSNQPRTGTSGSGNFGESDTSTPAWTVSSTYTINSRTQKEATRNGDAEDTSFTIGEDVIYNFASVVDSSSDPVAGVTIDYQQRNPNNAPTQSQPGFVTDSNGWTADPGAAFDTRAPAGGGWVQRATMQTHNGNTGTNDQGITMLSAFTANKNIIPSLGPVAGVPNSLGYMTPTNGNHAKPGDLMLGGLAMMVGGVRVLPDVAPELAIARFNTTTSKVEILQLDGTFQAKTLPGGGANSLYLEDGLGRPQFFPLKVSIEGGLEWIAFWGTAGQIQAAAGVPPGSESAVGYVMDSGTWPTGKLYMVCHLLYNGQVFYDDEWEEFVGASRQHPYLANALPEANIQFNTTTGHRHDGVDSRKSKTFLDPSGLKK